MSKNESSKTRHVDEDGAGSSQITAVRPKGTKHVAKDLAQQNETPDATRRESSNGNEVTKGEQSLRIHTYFAFPIEEETRTFVMKTIGPC